MRAKLPSCWLLSAGLVVACYAGALLAVPAEELRLRPSMTATSYIHVMPVEAFSSSFAELIRDAVGQSSAIEAAAARWHAEQFGVEAVAGAQLPSASVYAEAGFASSVTPSPYAYGVRISVPVYDGFSAGHATEAQASIASAARSAALDELAATLVDLVAAAASIRRAEDTLSARRTQHAATRELLTAIGSERETGTASKVDTDQVSAQLVQVDIEIRAAEAARLQAQESFAAIAGKAPGQIGTIGSLARLLPPNKAAAIDIAVAENPQLAQRFELASAAHSSRQSTAASFGPGVTFDITAGRSGDWLGQAPDTLDARAMLRLEIPLRFGTEAAVQQRALEAQAADFEVDAALTGVTAGIAGAYGRLDTTRTSLSLAYDALQRARSVLAGIKTERELGERSIFDLLTAQNALAEAQIRVSGLQYEVTIAEHLLAAQIGRLDDIYGVDLT